ncbi:tumor necrosis factor ligand superfamily member 15 [Nycticebus coucang]|uniref:tumor necrosis factor ligand superfamily member 15 n=1 Tax=Nycticebus coucang TaxID=9470 RepID=UPI00234E2FD6|nr:tumor necrosis factor ligand superfamily member 15 [Nycticebus coucang]
MGGSLARSQRRLQTSRRSMAEALSLGFRETASMEMLPEDGGYRPKAKSSGRWALTCYLVSLPFVAVLITYLLISQLRAHEEACVQFQALKDQEFGLSHQRAYTSFRDDGDKPRAHLTVMKQTPTKSLKNQFPALHWEHELGLAFTKNRMNYTNKFLMIPEAGQYFVYSQITFRGLTSECGEISQGSQRKKPDSITVLITKVTDRYPEPTQLLMGTKSVCEVGSNWFQPIYLAAMFSLQEGDKLVVNVSDISLVDYTKEDKTFFGAFLL